MTSGLHISQKVKNSMRLEYLTWFIQVLSNPRSKHLLSPYYAHVLHWELGFLVD